MKIVLFGASGTIGNEIKTLAEERKVGLLPLSRSKDRQGYLQLDDSNEWINHLDEFQNPEEPCSYVFCQGMNVNDDITETSKFNDVFSANVGFILEKLNLLFVKNRIQIGSSIVLVSSIWQEVSRSNKLSYSVSKSALKGLVNSLVADLSSKKIRVNAVLPGVVDSKMTRENLREEQLQNIISQTPSHSLVTARDVAQVVLWLCSPEASGVTGQFITVDNGWSNVRTV